MARNGEKSTVKPTRNRSGGAHRGVAGIVGAPVLPQVNLLPAWVRQKRALARTKVGLVILVGSVLVLSLLGFVAASLASSSAEEALAEAQQETHRLLTEQAKYSEVPEVLGSIEAAEAAQGLGMGHEVLWSGLVVDVMGALPDGARLTGFESLSVTPNELPPLPVDQLLTQGIGTVGITHRSVTVPDIVPWLAALAEIEGFVDPHATVAAIADDEGEAYYEVTTTVQLTTEALSGRYGAGAPKEDA